VVRDTGIEPVALSSTVAIAGFCDDWMLSAVRPQQFTRSLTPRPNPLEDRDSSKINTWHVTDLHCSQKA